MYPENYRGMIPKVCFEVGMFLITVVCLKFCGYFRFQRLSLFDRFRQNISFKNRTLLDHRTRTVRFITGVEI